MAARGVAVALLLPATAARAVVVAFLLLAATAARGDGGFVRASGALGPYTATVFSAPTPLRAGAADVSVLLQRRDGSVVLDAPIEVALRRRGDDTAAVHAAATRAQATNKLLHAALVEIPAPGAWTLEVSLDGALLAVDVAVAPPLPPWRTYWGWFALPFALLALFALQQWLVLRRAR